MNRRHLLGTLAGTTLALPLPAQAEKDKELAKQLKELLKESELPGVAALLIQNGKITRQACAGVRRAGTKEAITLDDKFHLGSCTKAMTSTLAAILVEQGKLKWTSTIGDFVKERWLHEDFKDVDLVKLLCHSSGCPAQPERALWNDLYMNQHKVKPVKQREKLAKGILSEEPDYEPGKKYRYSNSGYAIAGLMMERATKTPWEKLITKELFTPLGIKSAGFGAPGTNKRSKHPWGHRNGMPVPPEPYGDNPPAIGPAGTAHMTIEGWAQYALLHLGAHPNAPLKKAESFKMLHQVHSPERDYALGWGVREDDDGTILAHNGSNTYWYATISLQPATKTGVLVCVNAGGNGANKLCSLVQAKLLDRAE